MRTALAPHYLVEAELASGGMGVVFRAQEVALGRIVAVEVLRPELATAERVERFGREAKLLASLRHPNVVPIYHAGERDGLPYYTMPLFEGATLETRAVAGPLPVAEVVGIGRDILAALAVVHKRGIIHRDVKPANIFLVDGGALLGDFGIARLESAPDKLTSTGALLGTPAYMAPEQVVGAPATVRSDLYSLGAILYEALTGRAWVGGGARPRSTPRPGGPTPSVSPGRSPHGPGPGGAGGSPRSRSSSWSGSPPAPPRAQSPTRSSSGFCRRSGGSSTARTPSPPTSSPPRRGDGEPSAELPSRLHLRRRVDAPRSPLRSPPRRGPRRLRLGDGASCRRCAGARYMNSFEAPIGGITLGRRFAAQLVRRFPERRNYAAVLARVLIRAFRYLDQGDARLRAGDTTGARIAWLWHENNDVPGDLTDPAPIQAEGDWALATVAHWRQAQADPRACHALRSVHRLWRAGDSVHQRRAAWADSMARRAECPL